MQVLRQSTAADVLIGPFVDSTDGYTSEDGLSPSVELSKNGQTLAAKNDATTPTSDDLGMYNCELDATDTNTIEAGVEDGLGGIDSTTAFFRKIASSEAGNYTMSGDSPPTPLTSNGVVGCFRGVDTTTPMDVTYVQGDHYSKHDNAASVTNDPITTVTDGAWVLLYIWIGQGNVTDFTAPSGYTIAVKNAGQTSSNVALAYKEVATAGTETPGPWTATGISTTEEVVTVTLAIRPASTT